ncbi:hydroxyisourate hydrolase [Nocardia yamanashiensis]|uniref:hydroxyisourate hydrolase n=1 Tax=Nocardia yamanashiensis TaxID=209247 RepID=UPI001E308D89|nr:hydroxyisourate hydrolase [Nocardia yamanashiensis]UGT43291.1 hydroxyisourate hydrolase [Nocardia yamanashiensis]
MSLSTHVLNAATGRPAEGLAVRLEAAGGEVLVEARTDADGRIKDLPAPEAGVHRLIFDTGEISPFYPTVTIEFRVTDPAEHYHVPLLLSPYSFSTYRGS